MSEINTNKTTKAPKKKMSNFIKYPLVLGITCLVAGGAVVGVYAGTNPIVLEHQEAQKYNDAYTMLEGKLDTTKGLDGVEGFDTIPGNNKNINVFAKCYVTEPLMEGTDTESVRFYTITTERGYSGSLVVSMIIVGGKGNGSVYAFKLNSNAGEDSLGVNAYTNINVVPGYQAGEDFTQYIQTSGTAQKTTPVVQDAVDYCLKHYNSVGATYTGEGGDGDQGGDGSDTETSIPEAITAIVGENLKEGSVVKTAYEATENVLELYTFEYTNQRENATSTKGYYAKLESIEPQFGNVIFGAVIYEHNDDLVLDQIYLIDDSELNTESNLLYEQIINAIFDTSTKIGKVDQAYILGSDPGTQKGDAIITGSSSELTVPSMVKALNAAGEAISSLEA